MSVPEKEPTDPQTGSTGARRRAITVIGAGACIGVAVIAAVLSFLF
ncbi:MAG TPA: hypothetical protein VFC13_13870 [Actinomycetes bacterium]|jgi:hypothetical protein|nr:hypothetical protein [Actinomycetes bacterium]